MALMNSTPNSVSSTDGSETTFNTTVTSPFGNDSTYQNVTEGFTPGAAAGASIVSPIVMFLAGLIGNVLALVVLHKTKTEIRSMMFYTLVAALTWNDLLGICLTSPPVLAAYLNERHMPALPTLCRFHALAMVCFGLSTPFIVCTMAIERSLALKCSYFYSKYCTPHSARLTVAALWVFVLFFGALPLLGVGSFTLQYPQTWCFLHFRSYVPLDMAYAGAYAVLNLLVIMVMIFCNGLVMTTLCRVRKSKRRRMSSASSSLLKADPADEQAKPMQQVRRRHHRDVELQMIWLLFAITTIFSVCWAPLMMYILYCLQSPDSSSPVFGLVAVRLASLNQTLNPWIYVILRKSILARLARLWRHYRCSCRHENHKTSQTSEPRRPTGFHNPPIYLQRKGTTPKSSSPKKYVHVGHQLCPSSQFVGLQELAPKDRLLSGKKKGSRGSRSQSSHRWGVSQAWGEVSSGGLCSACRDRLKGGSEGRGNSHSTPSSLPSFPQSCGHVVLPVCSTVCEESVVDTRPHLSLPADGAYVDFFRHLPPACIARPSDLTPDEDGAVTYHPQACRGDVPAENVLSTASEADDHGYSSKMSTDSSPVSTPERSRPDSARLHGDRTGREEEVNATPFAAEDEKFQGTSFCSSHTCAGGPEQCAHGDLKEDCSVQNGGEQDALTAALDVKKMPLTGNACRRNDPSGEGHTDGAHSGQTAACDVADISGTAAFTQKRLRTPNPHVKLDGFFRDDSVDVTSGVFDCRDDGDDEDDEGDGGGGDDDDVYDDSLDPGQARKGDEGGEEEARGRRRVSSSRTLSSSSGGTLVDCGSGQDPGRAYFRQCSSSSAQ